MTNLAIHAPVPIAIHEKNTEKTICKLWVMYNRGAGNQLFKGLKNKTKIKVIQKVKQNEQVRAWEMSLGNLAFMNSLVLESFWILLQILPMPAKTKAENKKFINII